MTKEELEQHCKWALETHANALKLAKVKMDELRSKGQIEFMLSPMERDLYEETYLPYSLDTKNVDTHVWESVYEWTFSPCPVKALHKCTSYDPKNAEQIKIQETILFSE